MAGWNDSVIETFRANAGEVGGPFEGKTVVLVHTVGPKSGKPYVYPLVAAPDGDAWVLCGSMGGAPSDPQWIAALERMSDSVTVEIGAQTRTAQVQVIRPDGPEWARLYGVWRDNWPDAAEYEKKTDRKFPVAVVRFP